MRASHVVAFVCCGVWTAITGCVTVGDHGREVYFKGLYRAVEVRERHEGGRFTVTFNTGKPLKRIDPGPEWDPSEPLLAVVWIRKAALTASGFSGDVRLFAVVPTLPVQCLLDPSADPHVFLFHVKGASWVDVLYYFAGEGVQQRQRDMCPAVRVDPAFDLHKSYNRIAPGVIQFLTRQRR